MHQMTSRRLNPQKLLNSKWSKVAAEHKEKHFMVVKLLLAEDESRRVEQVVLEAVLTRRQWTMPWQKLLDETQWKQGW
ncbi:TIGR02450 family Trp-rich protein [Pseudomethylobacillus aquaticus]|nr:TIGR02450 family Trp-rich protein [Pseudomethylobacillus aquaticus]